MTPDSAVDPLVAPVDPVAMPADPLITPAVTPDKRKHHWSGAVRPMYARQWLLGPTPRHSVPEDGMPPATAYHLIHDELIMDGSSRFNLATF